MDGPYAGWVLTLCHIYAQSNRSHIMGGKDVYSVCMLVWLHLNRRPVRSISYSFMFLYLFCIHLSRWCLTTHLVTSTVAWPTSGGSLGTVMSSMARSVMGPPHYSSRVYPPTPTQVSKRSRIPHLLTHSDPESTKKILSIIK